MTNYEIMLIVDPKEDFKNVENYANNIFEKPDIKKLNITNLAYEINNSKTALYCLIMVKSSSKEIKEFTRKSNLSKTIWRTLIINLDAEKGREKSIELIEKRKEKLAKEYKDKMQERKPKIWNPYEKIKKNDAQRSFHE